MTWRDRFAEKFHALGVLFGQRAAAHDLDSLEHRVYGGASKQFHAYAKNPRSFFLDAAAIVFGTAFSAWYLWRWLA